MTPDIDFERRKLLKQMDPDDAIAFYLAGLPDERRALVYALWDVLTDLTGVVATDGFAYNKERLKTLVEVITDDLPELLHLAPEDRMPLELKEMFRSWISGFEHMLPMQRVSSNDRKQQLQVSFLLGAWLKAGLWVSRGVTWLDIKENSSDPAA